VEFHCLWGNNGSSVIKRWEFNQQQVEANSHIIIKLTLTYHILQITSVNLSDTGIYSCVVDINGSESEASERLRVYGMDTTVKVTLEFNNQSPKYCSPDGHLSYADHCS
jgi:hypothetical protein